MRKAGLDLAVGSFFYSSLKKRNNLEQAARCLVDHHIHIAKEKGTKKEMAKYLFTSESVTEGHPDKICDQISDAVLDAILEKDPDGRVACETAVTTGMVLVMGEISTKCYVDIPKIAREVIRDIGYDRAKFGFDCDTCGIITSIDEQSGDIALGVDRALEAKEAGITEEDNGAGDQGMMFGFACDDTPELMPMPISLAHKLAKRLAQVRKDGTLPYLRPDGKTQVTIEYEDDRPVAVETIVVSNQHSPDVPMEQLRADIKREVIDAIVPKELMRPETKIFINPTGRFVIGGPQGDSGLTGRKIIVDTYGGMGRHGGGAFSGKDPTKVDRSAAYAARYVAKNIRSLQSWPESARSSWPTPSAWRSRFRSTSTPSAPARLPMRSWSRRWRRSLTCVRPRSSVLWICAVRSTASSLPTARWAARIWASAGKRPTRSTRCWRLSNSFFCRELSERETPFFVEKCSIKGGQPLARGMRIMYSNRKSNAANRRCFA